MNEKKKTILTKEFKVNDRYFITRSDYENMPSPMLAWTWNDSRMTELASRINTNLAPYDESNPNRSDENFWETMEREAVKMGMEYYEDMENDYFLSLDYEWKNLK